MGTEQNSEAALSKLLTELFDSNGLQRWVRLHLGKAIHDELPTGLSLSQLAFEVTLVIKRHGRADRALFESLSDERPRQAGRIHEVARLWGLTTQAGALPDPGYDLEQLERASQPRRDYLQYILEMERERQPLTDIFTDLPGATRVSLEDVYIPPRLRMPRSLASVAERVEGEDILFDEWLVDVVDRYRETR